VSDGFNWGLTPRKPEPEKPAADEQTDDPFAFLTPTEPVAEPAIEKKPEPQPDWEGEPTQAMPQQQPYQPPVQQAAPVPPQFRPPSQYPQDTPQSSPPVPAWQLPPAQRPQPASQVPTQAEPLPTQRLPWEQPPTQVPSRQNAPVPPVAEPAQEQKHDAAASDIDDVFGDHAFREYDDGPLIGQIPRPVISRQQAKEQAATRPRAQKAAPLPGLTTTHKVLIGVAAVLIGTLALAAIYLAGTTNGAASQPDTDPVVTISTTPTSTATTTPSSSVALVGPVDPGTYEWNELLSSECLEPFENAWEQEYTVVDCDTPHTGQMTARGTFEGDAFPGVDELASQINLLCASTKVINYKKAAVYDDIAITASYPTTEQEWADGLHDYYCFVSRTSGDLITGTIARKPQPLEG
jgi:hypothetical protein